MTERLPTALPCHILVTATVPAMIFKSVNRLEALILFIGDVVILYVSLWVTLFIRNLSVPSAEAWSSHLSAFAILFAVWLLAFFIAGLYEKHTIIFQKRLPGII